MVVVGVPVDDALVPKKDGLQAEEKKTRRSIRGRRSSIKLMPEGSSPGIVAAPLSDSVGGDADISPTARLISKRDRIVAYMGHLQAEKEEWKNRLQIRKQLRDRAKRIADRGLERKRIERVPIDELGSVETTQKPRYILNRVVRAFNKQNEELYKQKEMNDLLARRAVLKESVAKKKAEAASLTAVLKAEPREELIDLEKWWEELKRIEEMRIPRLRAELSRLEMREALQAH